MEITRYGHSCLLVEDGDGRVLLDPGIFSTGFEDLTGLTGILITHQHIDHLEPGKLRALMEKNPEAKVYSDTGSPAVLEELPHQTVSAGDVLDLGTSVTVHGSTHAVIHPDIPVIPNVGYLIGGRFFTPGDALTLPDAEVEVLGLPTDAPWLKLSEAVEMLRSIEPALAFPVHDAVLTPMAAGIWYGAFDALSPDGTTFQKLLPGETLSR